MEKFINIEQLVKRFGLTKKIVWDLVSEKHIPYYRPMERIILFKEEEIMGWIEDSKRISQHEFEDQYHLYDHILGGEYLYNGNL